MSDEQKQDEVSPEEKEENRKTIINKYKEYPYWTFKEGIKLLLPEEYQDIVPLQGVINDSLFDYIKRNVETRKLKTINKRSEITDIVNYDPQAVWKKFCKENPREKPRRKSTYLQIKKEKQDYFYEKIKIKPALFIKYVKDNFDRFSEIEIPPELNEENDFQFEPEGTIVKPEKKEYTGTSEEKLHQVLIDYYSEIVLLYSGFTKNFVNNTDMSIANGDTRDFKRLALSFLSDKKNKKYFHFLKKEHIESDNIYEIRVRQRRATVGKILKIVIEKELPKVALDRTLKIQGNALFDLAKALCPKTD
jgi:hypothetical protein